MAHFRNHGWCYTLPLMGAALGGSLAHAQDVTSLAPVGAVAADPMVVLIEQVLKISPLAGLIALAAWSLSKMGPPTIRVIVAEEGPSMADRLAALEKRMGGE